MLIFTTNNRAICMSSSEQRHCETLLAYRWTHRTSPRGWTPPSQISSIIAQRRPAYENDALCYVMKGSESEQPVGAPFHEWVGCRDHAGIVCFPHSGSWQAQGGPVYICRDQRKCGFHNIGPLSHGVAQLCLVFFLFWCGSIPSKHRPIWSPSYFSSAPLAHLLEQL